MSNPTGENAELAERDASTSDTTQNHTKENTEYITGHKLLAVTGSTTLIGFLFLLDQSILSTAIPQITTDFHSIADVGWYTGAYPLASAALQPVTGKLYTYFRAKHTYLVFLFVFELGSLICGAANSSAMLIAGRVIAGLGSSGLMNGAMTIIAGCTPLEKRPLHTGFMMGVASLGIVIGPLIGGALTEHATWRWCFYLNVPVGVVAAAFISFIKIPDITAKDAFNMKLIRKVLPELDLFGFLLFAPAAVMFLLALQLGSEGSYDWSSGLIIGLFCGSGVVAILFGLWEWHMGDRAMLPGSMLTQRIVWASTAAHSFLLATMVGAAAFLPIYFQAVKGVGPTLSGVYLLPTIVTQLACAVLVGAAVSKLGYYLPWAVLGTALNVLGSGLISTFQPSTSAGLWIGFQIIMGAGRGTALQMPTVAVQNTLPPNQIPICFAFLMFGQNLATSVIVVIATTIFTQSLVSGIKKHAPSVSQEAALRAGGGAAAVRALVPNGGEELQGLLLAYSNAVNYVFYLMAGVALVAFAFSCGLGWKDVRGKKKDAGIETGEVEELESEKK